MKHLSFITTLSPQQQYEIRRWFLLSLTFILLMTIGIACYLGPDVYALYALKKEITALREKTKIHSELISTKNRLKKEIGEFQRKRTHLTTYLTHPKNPHLYITTITNACIDNIILQLIRTNKKNSEITLICPSTERAIHFAHYLTETGYFKDAHIISLQKYEQKNQFLCTIKGTLNRHIQPQ